MNYLIIGLLILTAQFALPQLNLFPTHNYYGIAYMAIFSLIYLLIGYLAGIKNQKVTSVIFFLIGIISGLGTLLGLMFVNAWR